MARTGQPKRTLAGDSEGGAARWQVSKFQAEEANKRGDLESTWREERGERREETWRGLGERREERGGR